MGKLLIIIGAILIVAGALISFLPKFPIGRLPGDIRVERENFSFYFPLATSLIISIILSIIIYLINRFKS